MILFVSPLYKWYVYRVKTAQTVPNTSKLVGFKRQDADNDTPN